jgi:hypothetical protein
VLLWQVPANAMNFSHRITTLSFSEQDTERHTLDGEVQVAPEQMIMFQYHLFVVASNPCFPRRFSCLIVLGGVCSI